jgi:predicted metal-dependent hydrolase
MLQLADCPPITYTRRRGQKSIRIRVKSDQIAVSAPYFCAEKAIHAFVNEKESWIRSALNRMNRKRISQQNLLEYHQHDLLLRGEWVPITVRHARPGEKKWLLTERKGRIDAYPPDTDIYNSRNLFSSLENAVITVPDEVKRDFLFEVARAELPIRFNEIASELPFKWTRLFIRSQRTKWGTCSSKGNISLNWRLIMCPPEIVRYLVVHELCHTVHMNHSKSYWKLVHKYFPNVDSANKWLKSEGNLCFQI